MEILDILVLTSALCMLSLYAQIIENRSICVCCNKECSNNYKSVKEYTIGEDVIVCCTCYYYYQIKEN